MAKATERQDETLRTLLMNRDVGEVFRQYDAGYHNEGGFDIKIEYGFSKCRVYLPHIWKRARIEVLEEIIDLAYRQIMGEDVPPYGVKSITFLRERYGSVPDRMYDHIRDRRKQLKKDMSKVRLTNTYIIGSIYPDLGITPDVTIWGRKIHATHFKK